MRKLLFVILCAWLLCGTAFAAADLWSLDVEATNVQYVRDNTTGFPAGSSYNLNMAMWVKFESVSADGAFCGTDVVNNDLWWFYDVDPGRLGLQLGDSTAGVSSGVSSSSWSPSIGEWYFTAVTYTYSTGAVYFWVGTSEVSHTTIGNSWRISAAGNFDVGAVYASWDSTDYTWMPFDGQIAGLIITTGTTWDSTAIASLYNSGTIDTSAWSSQSSIVRHYTFEEGTGTTTTNGYLTNTATLSGVSGTPTWTAFTTPVYATNFSPADEATGQNRAVKLSWTDDATADSHDLWGGTNPASLSQLQNDSTQEWYVVSGLTPGVPYYWRVDQVVGGSTYEGEVLVFTPTGKVGAR
jgi:hypothetical protein